MEHGISPGVGIDVPIVGDLLKTSPKQIFVGDEISPVWLGDVKHNGT